MNYSAIILSGGASVLFGKNKGLADLLGKPMIAYAVDMAAPLVNEVLVVTDNENDQEELSEALDPSVEVLVDEVDLRSPVAGAFTGFKHAKGEQSLLLSCDTPLISGDVISFLLEASGNHSLIIPRWSTGLTEPFQAIYNTKAAYEASLATVELKEPKIDDMITRLRNVLYISTDVIAQLDPKLNTFLKVNTLADLQRMKTILRGKAKGKQAPHNRPERPLHRGTRGR